MSDEKTPAVSVDGPFVLITKGLWEVCVQASAIAYIATELSPNTDGMRVSMNVRDGQVLETTFDTKDEASRFAAQLRKAALEAGNWRRG